MNERRPDLEELVKYRRKNSYKETLDCYGLKPGGFFYYIKEAFVKKILSQKEFEACLEIEKGVLEDYLRRIQRGEIKQVPFGTWKNQDNIATAIEIIFEQELPGYLSADREERIKLIRRHVINYKTQEGKNGPQRFFYEKKLRGMLDGSNNHIRKENSPLAAIEVYDTIKKTGFFDRSKNEYLGRWEISEIDMWKDKKLAVEAVEDVLWRIPGFRFGTREDRIMLIREQVINYKPNDLSKKSGAKQFFGDEGLKGMLMNSCALKKRNSPIAALKFYDQKRNTRLFDNVYKNYLDEKEFNKGRKIT